VPETMGDGDGPQGAHRVRDTVAHGVLGTCRSLHKPVGGLAFASNGRDEAKAAILCARVKRAAWLACSEQGILWC
jgi:hypothetical protein